MVKMCVESNMMIRCAHVMHVGYLSHVTFHTLIIILGKVAVGYSIMSWAHLWCCGTIVCTSIHAGIVYVAVLIDVSANLVWQREKLPRQMLELVGKCPVTDCYYECWWNALCVVLLSLREAIMESMIIYYSQGARSYKHYRQQARCSHS
jgi:hypothetical protein